jgi:hypothetical protein
MTNTTMLSQLTPGTFFKMDDTGDVVLRFRKYDKGNKRFYFHAMGIKEAVHFSQPEDCQVWIMTELPNDVKDTLIKEFNDEMKERIMSNLNPWEIAILCTWIDGKQLNVDDMKAQFHDNPQLMKEMIGDAGANILAFMPPSKPVYKFDDLVPAAQEKALYLQNRYGNSKRLSLKKLKEKLRNPTWQFLANGELYNGLTN